MIKKSYNIYIKIIKYIHNKSNNNDIDDVQSKLIILLFDSILPIGILMLFSYEIENNTNYCRCDNDLSQMCEFESYDIEKLMSSFYFYFFLFF